MPTVNPSPWGPKPQIELASGLPAVGGLLFWYVGGSVGTKQTTYTDSTGTVANANPVVLNSLGMPTNEIWLTQGQLFKLVYAPAGDTDPPSSPIFTVDNIRGQGDVTVAIDQWIASGLAPTFVNATSFTLVGDQTSAFHIGRRLKTTNSGGTIYSTISNSVFGALTTVTVVNDSGVLDSGLSAVSYGIISAINSSIRASLLATQFTAKGSLLSASASGVPLELAVGAAGTIPMARPAAASGIAYVAALKSYIAGGTYANNSGDATNDIDIAATNAMDATGAYFMVGAALTKQSDVAWAVGNAAGGLDTGAVGNSDYYIWEIARSDTGVVDYLFSLSSTAPTMPGAGAYDFKRLIGWFKRAGGTIVAFKTYETAGGGLELAWDVPTLDVNLASTLTTSRRTDAVKVPLNFSVEAHLNVVTNDAASNAVAWICCPDQTDAAPSRTVAPLYNVSETTAAEPSGTALWVRTSAAGLIAARSDLATVDLYAVVTLGFKWARR